MSESLEFSTDCEDCGQDMERSESGEWYYCENCDKDSHRSELFTY